MYICVDFPIVLIYKRVYMEARCSYVQWHSFNKSALLAATLYYGICHSFTKMYSYALLSLYTNCIYKSLSLISMYI